MICHLCQDRDDYNKYPQEVPFPILPWSLGASPQPDCDGGVQLRHGESHHHDHGSEEEEDDDGFHPLGGFLPPLFL